MNDKLSIIAALFVCAGITTRPHYSLRPSPMETVLTAGNTREWLLKGQRRDSMDVPVDNQRWTFRFGDHSGIVLVNSIEGATTSKEFSWKLINESKLITSFARPAADMGRPDTLDIDIVSVRDTSFAPRGQKFLRLVKFAGPRYRYSTHRESLFLQPADVPSNWNGL